MSPLTAKSISMPEGLNSCSGCSLCLLPCPVWRQKRDIRFAWHGRAKAFQHGATPEDIAGSLLACTFCGSCDTLCPEGIDLRGTMERMRSEISNHPARGSVIGAMAAAMKTAVNEPPAEKTLLLAGEALGSNVARLEKVLNLIGGEGAATAADNGRDIALAIEAGIKIPKDRLRCFLDHVGKAKELIVAEGILIRAIKEWLPYVRVSGIGEFLSRREEITDNLKPTDLYVIESRAYNSDFDRLVGHYDRLKKKIGCAFNLDLNRIATPTTATSMHHHLGMEGIDIGEQVRWLLEGRDVERIVVESMEDGSAFTEATDVPVVHLSDIAGE